MQICLRLNPFSVSKRIQETLGRFMILQKKVCLELGREHFTVFPPCIFLLPISVIPIYSEGKSEKKKKKNTPLPSFRFIFYFSWKIPIEWVKKNQMYPGNMPFRILEWELQTKLVKESNA